MNHGLISTFFKDQVANGRSRQIQAERTKYDPVSMSQEELANNEATRIYKPLDLPEPYKEHESATFEPFLRVRLARLIPQDGRIQLPFDMHAQLMADEWFAVKKAYLAKLDKSVDLASVHIGSVTPELREKLDGSIILDVLHGIKPAIKALESFFETDFNNFGEFFIWDTDPSHPNRDVLYDLNCMIALVSGDPTSSEE